MFTGRALNPWIIIIFSLSLASQSHLHTSAPQRYPPSNPTQTRIHCGFNNYIYLTPGLQFPWFPERFHDGRLKTWQTNPRSSRSSPKRFNERYNEHFHLVSLLTGKTLRSQCSVLLFSLKDDGLFWGTYTKDRSTWCVLRLQKFVAALWRPTYWSCLLYILFFASYQCWRL